jgi:hypothetical protein
MKKQQSMRERIYSIETRADKGEEGFKLASGQTEEAKQIIREIYKKT